MHDFLAATTHSIRAPLMFDSTSVSDVSRFHFAERDSCHDQIEQWRPDGQRIMEWQVQLVDSCESISQQLSQIRSGLNGDDFPESKQGVELRIVSAV